MHASRRTHLGRNRLLVAAEALERRMLLNAAPVAVDDHYETDEDQLLFNLRPEAGVLANDYDVESDELSAILVDDVVHGALSLNEDGSFAYAPHVDFHGTDRFTYAARDTQRSNIATVTIEVRSQYDPPIAAPDAYTLSRREESAIDNVRGVLGNDLSPEGATLTALLQDDVGEGVLTLHADGSFQYDAQGFVGTTSFSYRASDGSGQSNAVTVSLTVTDRPVARSDEYGVPEDTLLLVSASEGLLANDSFAEDGSISVIVDQMPRHGALAMKPDGSFAYGPDRDFAGDDGFTYRLSDGPDASETVTVTLQVAAVNDAPIPAADAYLVSTDQRLSVSAGSGLLANDVDLEGDPFIARLIDAPEYGSLDVTDDGAFVYTPSAGFSGDDQFTYVAADAVDQSPPVLVRLIVASQPVTISEFMADNVSTLLTRIRGDSTERFRGEPEAYDWIELRNRLDQPLPVGGLHLTDDRANPTKWPFPGGTTIPPNGYLVVYASGEDVRDPARDDNDLLHTNFSLSRGGEYLAVTAVDGQTLFEWGEGYPDQRVNVSYGLGANDVLGYFVQPTPGAANVDARTGEVAAPIFSRDRGIYDGPISVEITTATEGATIRYTRDGTPPTESHGVVYTGPVSVSTTTTLRAAAFKDGMMPTDVDTRTYLFLDSVLRQSGVPDGYPARWRSTTADYEMSQNSDDLPLIAGDPDLTEPEYEARIRDSLRSLPTLSLVLPPSDLFDARDGIYANPGGRGQSWERAASVEYLRPDGAEGFQIDAGLRIMGGTSRNLTSSPKQSFRLLFKRQYGEGRLEFPFFENGGIDSFNTLTLRSNTRDGWTTNGTVVGPLNETLYIRDQWAKAAQAAMGQLATSGNFVHLYLNGLYWGVYNATERPDAAFSAEHLGGNDTDYDAVKFCCPDRVVDGSMDPWNELLRLARAGLESDEAYERILGNHPDGTPDPNGTVLLDVDNFIDFVINGQYHAAVDWPGNYYVARRRGDDSDGFQFYTWDNDLAFPSLNVRQNKVRPDPGHNWWTESPGEIDIAIRRNAEYRMRFADRAHMHLFHDGALTPEKTAKLWSDIADSVETALIAESARWGDYRRDVAPAGRRVLYTVHEHWRPTVDRMLRDYFPRRTEIVVEQLRAAGLYPAIDAPEYLINGNRQYGGSVPVEASLTIGAADAEAEIYFTRDGSDPRQHGGAVSPSAIRYDGPVTLDELTTVKSRVFSGGVWSALSNATFTVDTVPAGPENLRITELAFHPHAPLPQFGELNVDEGQFEFLELANIGPQAMDLGGARLVETRVNEELQGIAFQFATQILAPGERLVVVKDVAAFQSRYGPQVRLAEGNDGLGGVERQFGGKLSNGGERLTLLAADDSVIQQFAFDDSQAWPGRADGNGSSLEIVDVQGDYEDPANWRSSREFGGSPGGDGNGSVHRVVINEVFSNSQPPSVDWVELHNPSDSAVEIGGWYLSDTNDNYFKFTIPATAIAPGGYQVFSETELGFALNSRIGDDVWLLESDTTGRPRQFVDHVEFGAAAAGVALGRWPDATGPLVAMRHPTPSQGNSGPADPDLLQPGDANGDGIFDPSDLVAVLQAAKYQTGAVADWSEGDWNRDGVFDPLDLVLALQSDFVPNTPRTSAATR